MTKRLTALLLALALTCTLALPAFAAAEPVKLNRDTSSGSLPAPLTGNATLEDADGIRTLTITSTIELESKYLEFENGNWKVVIGSGQKITRKSDGGTTVLVIDKEANVTLTGGTVESQQNSPGIVAVNVKGGALTVDNCTITAKGTAIGVFNDDTNSYHGSLNVVSGTITSEGERAVATNGSLSDGVTINISGGTLTGSDNEAGIYLPAGTLTVSGSDTTISGGAGIVARGGTLNVHGGTIEGKSEGPFSIGDGASSVYGAGIVMEPSGGGYDELNVTIDGGTIKGTGDAKAVEVTNGSGPFTPHISNGKFEGEIGGDGAADKLTGQVTGGTFNDESVTQYVTGDTLAVSTDDSSYSVGQQAKDVLSSAKEGDKVKIEKAPAGADLDVPVGVDIENATGSQIKVNGTAVNTGATVRAARRPAPPAPEPEDDGTEYIICEACGYQQWEPYLDGWKCTHCGHLRGTTGVPAAATAAAAGGPRSPQTGLWWLLG